MEEQQVTTETVKPMPFTERLVNIFASPGELFENVRLTPPTSTNWIIPLILMIVVALAMSEVIINNPSLRDQMAAMVKKTMEESVQKGQMSQEQADQAYEQFASPTSTMAKVIRIVVTILAIPIITFVVALAYFLLGKWGFKATAPYMKVLEVVGLTLFIGVLESIVTTIMAIALDSLTASPGVGAFIADFDFQNKLHVALSKINLFTFWSLAVTSIGLAKLFQRDFAKVLFGVVGIWVVWTAISVLAGIRISG